MKRWSEAATFQSHRHCYFLKFIYYFCNQLARVFSFQTKKKSLLQIHEFYFRISSVTKNTLSSCCKTTNIPTLFLSNCFIKVALTLNVRCLTPTAAQKLGHCVCLMHMQPHLWVVEAADLGCCLIVDAVSMPVLARLSSCLRFLLDLIVFMLFWHLDSGKWSHGREKLPVTLRNI